MLSHFHCSSERWERSFSCWGFAWGLVLSCLLAGHIGACLLRPSCPQWPNSVWTLCLDLPCTVLPEFSLIFPASDILYCFPSCGLAALWPEAQFCSPPPPCAFCVPSLLQHPLGQAAQTPPSLARQTLSFSSGNETQTYLTVKSVFFLSIHITSKKRMTGRFGWRKKA